MQQHRAVCCRTVAAGLSRSESNAVSDVKAFSQQTCHLEVCSDHPLTAAVCVPAITCPGLLKCILAYLSVSCTLFARFLAVLVQHEGAVLYIPGSSYEDEKQMLFQCLHR